MAEILMITPMGGAENCAALLSKQFQMEVKVALSRKEALAALRRREYLLIILDESLITTGDEPGYDGSDPIYRQAGLAIPLEINFGISGYGRLARAVRAALHRREREKEAAMSTAKSAIQKELREQVAGLLLHAQLALAEPVAPPQLVEKLRIIAGLALDLRQRLGDYPAPPEAADSIPRQRAAPLPPRMQSASIPSAALPAALAAAQRRKPDDPAFVAMRHRQRPAPQRPLD